MRQIDVQVRTGRVDEVVRLGGEHGGFAPSSHPIRVGGEEGWSLVVVNLPNESVGAFVAAVEREVEEAEFILPTAGTIPIRTPVAEVRDRVRDVSHRSTLELVLDVLQSLGTWTGMLIYAVVSGLVAAYGVMFNVSFLLTAAMLIAPLGAPVMVCVVAVVIGDLSMLRRGALRFAVALVVLAAAAAGLGVAYGLTDSTAMMETLTNLSVWTGLLGVAGGAAGAQALVQTERDSLVTATATGFLVAVSLSPPSAVLGLSVALARWDYVALMGFVLALTFAGILLGGWAALRFAGVGPDRPSAGRGRPTVSRVAIAAVAVAVLSLVAWQSQQGARFRKADMSRVAARLAAEGVAAVPGYRVLEATAAFTPGNAEWHEGEGLLVTVVVKAVTPPGVGTPDSDAAGGAVDDAVDERARAALRRAVRERVEAELEGVRPFVDLEIVP
jgi:uncharacterized membrane protein